MASSDFNPRPVMLRRFGYFAFGIAIGFLMLGLLRMGKQEEVRRREAQAAQAVIEAEKGRTATPIAPISPVPSIPELPPVPIQPENPATNPPAP